MIALIAPTAVHGAVDPPVLRVARGPNLSKPLAMVGYNK